MDITFQCYEHIGCEVYEVPPDGDTPPQEVRDKDAMKQGARFWTFGMMGERVYFTVEVDEHGAPHGKAGRLSILLEFDKDDRHCWVACGFVNLSAVKKLELYKEDDGHT
jgi:hypothetical protein